MPFRNSLFFSFFLFYIYAFVQFQDFMDNRLFYYEYLSVMNICH